MRALEDLTLVEDPAWPLVLRWAAAAPLKTVILPRDAKASARCLWRLQVTTRSVLIDHGWLRLLGGGPACPTSRRRPA